MLNSEGAIEPEAFPEVVPKPKTQIRLRPITDPLIAFIKSPYRFERRFRERHVTRFEELDRPFVRPVGVRDEGARGGEVARETVVGEQELVKIRPQRIAE